MSSGSAPSWSNFSELRVGRATPLPGSTFDVRLVPNKTRAKGGGDDSRRQGPIWRTVRARRLRRRRLLPATFHARTGSLFGGQVKFRRFDRSPGVSRKQGRARRRDVRRRSEKGALAELSPSLSELRGGASRASSAALWGSAEFHMKTPSRVAVQLEQCPKWDITRKGYRVKELASGSRPIVFEKGRFSLPGLGFTATTPRGQRGQAFDAQGAVFNVATFRADRPPSWTLIAPDETRLSLVGRNSARRAGGGHARSPASSRSTGPLLAPRFAGGFDESRAAGSLRFAACRCQSPTSLWPCASTAASCASKERVRAGRLRHVCR